MTIKKEKEKGHIVTHTHWDREWRYPVWENRMLLVNLMEELLETLDTNPEYKSFILDGQSVVIEDYLKARPQDESRIKKHVKSGRLSVGPWYTLPDLYPVDGECLIRNLMKGIRVSDSLGGHMNIAYESFGWGQTAQFPQIYKGFGFDIVIVGKNVSKDRAPQSEFLWEAPDGTSILSTRLGQHARANFFMNSYMKIMTGKEYISDEFRLEWDKAGVIYHQADEDNFHQDYLKLENTESIHEEVIREAVLQAWKATDDTTVKEHRTLMNGSDSTTSQPFLTELVKKANELFEDRELVLSSLEEYTGLLKKNIDLKSLRTVKGELRDGPASACSANALMTRPALKILNKKVQNSLLNKAEPVSAINSMLGVKYDKTLLDHAVKFMLLSHPHDSINGVTQDKTAEDVMYSLNQALEISEVISNRACGEIIKRINTGCYDQKDILLVVFNFSPFERKEIMKAAIDFPGEYNVWDFDLLDHEGNRADTQVVSRKEEVVPVNDLHSRPLPFYADRHLIYFDTGMVPAGGYKVYRAVPTKEFNRKAVFWAEMRKSTGSNIVKVDNVLENDYLKVEVQNNGTINVLQKEQNRLYKELNYFEDSGDNGDYWMYYPPHHNRTFTSKGLQARIWVADNGPLSATVAAEIKMLLPAHALRPENEIRGESRRADEEKELTATVYYTLKRDSRKVDIKLVLNNTIEDHRFRVMFDTGIKARNANAAGHFTVDKRPVAPVKDAQGEYWPEMQTLPQQNFVDLDDGKHGFAVVNNCLTEYEAMDNDRGTLALTLLRGVRNIICTEFRSAGVFPRQKGGQSLGMHCYEYSIYPHKGDWVQASVYREAASLNVPLKPVQTSRNEKGCLGLKNSFYSIEPANLIMSALKKTEDRESIILRVFNPTNKPIDGIIKFYSKISKAWLTNMNEERMEELKPVNADKLEIKAGPNKILTLELEVGGKSNV